MLKESKHFNVHCFFAKAGTYKVDKLVDYLEDKNLSDQAVDIMIKLLDAESTFGWFTGIISTILSLVSAIVLLSGNNKVDTWPDFISTVSALAVIFLAGVVFDKVANTLHNANYKKALLIYKLERQLEKEEKSNKSSNKNNEN